MKTKNYKCYSDPGHGWAVVTRKELIQLGIEHKISRFSYQRGDKVYLEEDADLSLFVNTQLANGIKPKFNGTSSDKQSRIRNYASFVPETAPAPCADNVDADIYEYSGEQLRPNCPTCGASVEPFNFTDNPEIVFAATCPAGHEHRYQYDDTPEEDDMDEDEDE